MKEYWKKYWKIAAAAVFLTAAGSAITPRRRFIISPSHTAGRAASQGENLQIVFLIVFL